MRLITFDLADIGRLAVDAERARRDREGAKRAHRKACSEFYEAGGQRWEADDDGNAIPTPEYVECTETLYQAHMAASRACANITRRFRNAVKKFDAASGYAPK